MPTSAKLPDQAFDLEPWRSRLEAIQAERDARRTNTTLRAAERSSPAGAAPSLTSPTIRRPSLVIGRLSGC